MGPRMPQRWSRPPWPQINIVGFVMGCAGGSFAASDSSRRRLAFCAAERPLCMGWRVFALRYAVAKWERASGECGMFSMRLKLGKRRAVVVCFVLDCGREEAVMSTLVNGCSRRGFVSKMKHN